jgi:hypothetical protein
MKFVLQGARSLYVIGESDWTEDVYAARAFDNALEAWAFAFARGLQGTRVVLRFGAHQPDSRVERLAA